MAHNLETKQNGETSFVAMHTPGWHQLGHTVSDLATWREICDKFMDFEIDKIQLKNPLTAELSDFYGLFRSDNCEMLHVVKAGYEVTQNSALFEFIDALIGSENVNYETAGVLGKGEKVFVTARTGEFDVMASGDVHKTFLLAATSHDGSMSETYKLTETRVVCNNTLNMALRENGKELKFKHTKNAANRRRDALRLLQATRAASQNLQEKFEVLAQRIIKPSIISQTLAQLFKLDLTKIKSADDLSTKQSNQISAVNQLFESNDNNAFPQFRGTAYNFINAITEYADHYRDTRGGGSNGTTAERQRAYSAIFGSGDALKREAVELVLELTNGAELTNQKVIYSLPSDTSDNGGGSFLDSVLDATVIN